MTFYYFGSLLHAQSEDATLHLCVLAGAPSAVTTPHYLYQYKTSWYTRRAFTAQGSFVLTGEDECLFTERRRAVSRVARSGGAADLSPATVDDPDVFLSVGRKRYLLVSGVQILHRRLLGRKLLHMCLTHADNTHTHTRAEINKKSLRRLNVGHALLQSNYVNTHTQ